MGRANVFDGQKGGGRRDGGEVGGGGERLSELERSEGRGGANRGEIEGV